MLNKHHQLALDDAIISLLLTAGVSLAYLMIHDEKQWYKKIGVGMHGIAMIAGFVYALKASFYTKFPQYAHLIDIYYIFPGLFLIATFWSLFRFKGPKWFHLLLLPNFLFAYWIGGISLGVLKHSGYY